MPWHPLQLASDCHTVTTLQLTGSMSLCGLPLARPCTSTCSPASQVKEAYRHRQLHSLPGIRAALWTSFDDCTGWIAVALIGILMAAIACAVDLAVATVSDLKFGYCGANLLLNRESCCRAVGKEEGCADFKPWAGSFWPQFAIYVGWAALFGIISSTITMLSKRALPAAAPGNGDKNLEPDNGDLGFHQLGKPSAGKSMYMAAGSGIPEIKASCWPELFLNMF